MTRRNDAQNGSLVYPSAKWTLEQVVLTICFCLKPGGRLG